MFYIIVLVPEIFNCYFCSIIQIMGVGGGSTKSRTVFKTQIGKSLRVKLGLKKHFFSNFCHKFKAQNIIQISHISHEGGGQKCVTYYLNGALKHFLNFLCFWTNIRIRWLRVLNVGWPVNNAFILPMISSKQKLL